MIQKGEMCGNRHIVESIFGMHKEEIDQVGGGRDSDSAGSTCVHSP